MAERKKLLLRLDPEVYDAVARWASDDLRSVNAQIEYALRRALRAVGRYGGDGRESAIVQDPDTVTPSVVGPDAVGPDVAAAGADASQDRR